MTNYNEIKSLLLEKLSSLVDRAGNIENVLRSPGDKDWSENALTKENDETLVALGDFTDHEIRDIRLAIDRIESGEYGKCIKCSQTIAKDRLLALPWATTCIHCAK